MNDSLVLRYGRLSAPRYTSYPTAADFAGDVGADEKAHWLETLAPNAPLSLYLHVPYCRDICGYCGCATKMAVRDHVLDDYRRLLEKEIELTAQRWARPPRVARLHWGGGTPSILGADGLAALIERLSRHVRFEPGFEHAIELDPRHVTPALARGLAKLSVNRASFGVQDVDPQVQQAIRRVQPLETVKAAFAAVRSAGVEKINVDLIHGLPKQTVDSVAETAFQVIALAPDRVACYGYAHLPAARRNQRLIDEADLPDVEERFAQARAIADCFGQAGYEAIGIDHFATPDDPLAKAARERRLRRNFQGYTDDEEANLIGFGASAISCLLQGFAQNLTPPRDYAAALGEGRLPVARGWRLTEDDRMRGAIIHELMCQFRVDLKRHAPPGAFGDELALLRPLIADGLVEIADDQVRMTPLGRPFVRVAAVVFDAFLSQRIASQFSTAV